jgi:Fibronectin type III domain
MSKTPKTPLNIIKPVLGVNGVTDGDLLARLNAIHDGMSNNPAYPNPPVDMAGLKAAIDAYTAASTAALDGGKNAIAERNKRRADAVIIMRLLGHYVEVACKGDTKAFVSSGFVAVAPRPKGAAQPIAVPPIVKIDQGITGQLLVTLQSVKARSYDLRYAPVPVAGAAINWTTVVVPNAKPAVPVNNLTPGTTYTFQVRAFGKQGFTEWSSSVERMAI